MLDLTGLKYDRNMLTLLASSIFAYQICFNNLRSDHFQRGPLSSISAFMSEHYVELIHAFVLVNAPNFISTIWYKSKRRKLIRFIDF